MTAGTLRTPTRDDPAEALALGEARYRADDHAAAAIFVRIGESAPDHPAALRLFGLCRLRQGNAG